MRPTVHHSKARIKALETFIFDLVIERSQAFEVSDVKCDGTVFVRFRSVTEASASACASSFREACEGRGVLFVQTEANKFRLALDQFAPSGVFDDQCSESHEATVVESDNMDTNTQLPKCQLTGVNGNVYSIIGTVAKALVRAGLRDRAIEFQKQAVAQPSYDAVLQLCHQFVDVH